MRKVLFMDMDGTLIETKSGKTFPVDNTDWKFKDGVISAIENYGPEHVHIITNQGGIGRFITKDEFETKLGNVRTALELIIRVNVTAVYCDSMDPSNPRRKPNPGMIEEFLRNRGSYDVEFLMVGDASGNPGDFSDSDKKCAENARIPYMDIKEFIRCYK